MSDHGEAKARESIMPEAPPPIDPIERLRQLLAVSDLTPVRVSLEQGGISRGVTITAGDLRPLVQDELDRASERFEAKENEDQLDAAHTRISALEVEVGDVESALMPFADAGRRLAMGDSLVRVLLDVTEPQLQAAYLAMQGRGV